jgi:RNA polymerase sigma-70 factor, ECF subfamily
LTEPAQAKARGQGVARSGEVSSSGRDERELIERIKNGEKELFYELIRPHERRVYVTAFAILQNEADAQDVAQEAILKVFMHLWQFRLESRFSTWLIQVTVNEARMRIRKNHPELISSLAEPKAGQEESDYTPRDFADWREIPSETLERQEVRELLKRALLSLAQKYREVFVLRDVQHLRIEETAEALGISPGAVKTRLLRARLMLRDFLAPGLEGFWNRRLPFQKGEKPWT